MMCSDSRLLDAMLPYLTNRWRDCELSDATYAAGFFMLWQIDACGSRFATRKRKQDDKPDPNRLLDALAQAEPQAVAANLTDALERYQFLGISPQVPAALLNWIRGRWRLQLLERIPTPREVLNMQCDYSRPVTVLTAVDRRELPVLHKADAFQFMLHDLEHAWKFFHDERESQEQRRVFCALQAVLNGGRFDQAVETDIEFRAKFDYLISDMNTHPEHSRSFLQAILIEHFLRREGKPLNGSLSSASWHDIQRLVEEAIPRNAELDRSEAEFVEIVRQR